MSEKRSNQPTRGLFPIMLATFINMLGIGLVVPVISPLIINNPTGIVDAALTLADRNIVYGFLIASYPLTQFFGAPILGTLSDRFGRKRILGIALIGSMLGFFVFAWGIITNDLTLLFTGRIIDGFTGGNISIVYSSIADLSTKENKARNFGLVGMMFGLGFIFGPVLGGLLADSQVVSWFSPQLPFWVSGVLCGLNALLVFAMVPETLKEAVKGKINVLTGILNIFLAFRMPNLRSLFVTILLFTLGFAFFTTFCQVMLIQEFDFGTLDIGFLFGEVGIFIAFTQGFLIRPVGKRFSSRQILRISLLGLSLVLASLMLLNKVWMLYALMPFIAFFQGLCAPFLNALVSGEATADQQGQIMGINQSIASLGIAAPALIAGYLGGYNSYFPIAAASFFVFLAWLSFFLVFSAKATA